MGLSYFDEATMQTPEETLARTEGQRDEEWMLRRRHEIRMRERLRAWHAQRQARALDRLAVAICVGLLIAWAVGMVQ